MLCALEDPLPTQRKTFQRMPRYHQSKLVALGVQIQSKERWKPRKSLYLRKDGCGCVESSHLNIELSRLEPVWSRNKYQLLLHFHRKRNMAMKIVHYGRNAAAFL